MGTAGLGIAGKVRCGEARCGIAGGERFVMARYGMERQARSGSDGQGVESSGKSRLDKAW